MPLNKKGKKIMNSMQRQYGAKRGAKVFYASLNKKKIKGVKKLNKVAKALGKASKLHKKQSNIIKKHIKEMKSYGRSKKREQVKNQKDLVEDFTQMKILKILLE